MSGRDYFNIEIVPSAFLAKLTACIIGPLALRIGDSGPHQFCEIIFLEDGKVGCAVQGFLVTTE
jgi:hypothetical protein